jgi:hypothetical protein
LSYIDITYDLLYDNCSYDKRVLVLCPGFKLSKVLNFRANAVNRNIITNDSNLDINEWVNKYLNKNGLQFDLVIASRVLEHLPARNIDFYLFNIYNVMKKDGLFISIVPNMEEIVIQLINEHNSFLTNRLNFELFGEGEHQWDFHKTFTSISSMHKILNREKLFVVEKVDKLIIETDIVPPYLVFHARRT